jgi:hypothetical protein
MAKKRKKEHRVAEVDANGLLVRDLKGVVVWLVISIGIASVLALIQNFVIGL